MILETGEGILIPIKIYAPVASTGYENVSVLRQVSGKPDGGAMGPDRGVGEPMFWMLGAHVVDAKPALEGGDD